MNLPSDVIYEIERNDVKGFIPLPLDHEAVSWGFAFLMHVSLPDMARALRILAQEGRVRIGPLKGFVASAAIFENQAYILLSNSYPQYNTSEEIMASLVGEIGALEEFNCAPVENEDRIQKALEWLKNKRSPQQALSSFISVAVSKKDKRDEG